MAIVGDNATLYAAQATNEQPSRLVKMQEMAGSTYGMGPIHVLWSELAAVTGGGEAGDYINFCKLPPGTMIVGGWLYWETGLGGTDGELADLGIVYEAGDGTDDVDALLDGIDVYDGQTAPLPLAALPAGSIMLIGTDVAAFPYKVTGGWGTVRLTSVTGDLVTAKDVKLLLYVIYPA